MDRGIRRPYTPSKEIQEIHDRYASLSGVNVLKMREWDVALLGFYARNSPQHIRKKCLARIAEIKKEWRI